MTLSGRFYIWRSAWSLIGEAGPTGFGAGTTTMAYRHGGDSTFSPLIVDHLHCDPLECVLEYGWGNAIVGLFGLAASIYLLLPGIGQQSSSDEFKIYYKGAILGVLSLSIHSCADFIFHNAAIDLLFVILMVIASQCRQSPDSVPIQSTYLFRLNFLLPLVPLVPLMLSAYRYENDNIIARNVGSYTFQRINSHLPIVVAGPIEEAIGHTPNSVNLAFMQAWIFRNLQVISANRSDGLQQCEKALQIAAFLSPGDARTWIERASLDVELGHPKDAVIAVHRALQWAPAWPDIQRSILEIAVKKREASGLSDIEMRRIIEDILSHDMEQPSWFFTISAQALGDNNLSRIIRSSGLRIKRSAFSWMASHGNLADWIYLVRELSPQPYNLPAECLIMGKPLLESVPFKISIPFVNYNRRQLSDLLMSCGLPLPSELSSALKHDGSPWSIWAAPFDEFDQMIRINISALLRGELHHDWARAWADRINFADRILGGEWSAADRNSDPGLLFHILSHVSTTHLPERERLRIFNILQRYRVVEWKNVTDHAYFGWFYVDSPDSHAYWDCQNWNGLVIDGKWIGWCRGHSDFSTIAGLGLHRLVILIPNSL